MIRIGTKGEKWWWLEGCRKLVCHQEPLYQINDKLTTDISRQSLEINWAQCSERLMDVTMSPSVKMCIDTKRARWEGLKNTEWKSKRCVEVMWLVCEGVSRKLKDDGYWCGSLLESCSLLSYQLQCVAIIANREQSSVLWCSFVAALKLPHHHCL